MADRINVFISSTSRDLVPYRNALIQVVLRLGLYPITMETFNSSDRNALQTCYDKVCQSEIFVGIYAHRYGYVPDTDLSYSKLDGSNHTSDGKTSITHLEYLWALEKKIPMLFYLIADTNDDGEPVKWVIADIDDEPKKSQLSTFKQQILNRHVVDFFSSPDELAVKAATGLAEVLQDSRSVNPISPSMNPNSYLFSKPSIPNFIGREAEIAQLSEWIRDNHCKIVLVQGIGGIGKSSICSVLIDRHGTEFDCVIWYSVKNAPLLKDLIRDVVAFISKQGSSDFPEVIDKQINLLVHFLNLNRILLIIDNYETVMQTQERAGTYQVGYEDYRQFIYHIADAQHRSKVIITSREKPSEFSQYSADVSPARIMNLRGLAPEEGRILLDGYGLVAEVGEWTDLVQKYSGNPLALKLAGSNIKDLFDGNVKDFITQGATLFGSVRGVIAQQFQRLNHLEKDIIYWLAIEREAIGIEQIQSIMITATTRSVLLDMLLSLVNKSLVEIERIGSIRFTLQNVVMEYVIETFIERVATEILSNELDLVVSHAIARAQTKEYIRASQTRIIMKPLVSILLAKISRTTLENKLLSYPDILRNRPSISMGYAAGNLINLMTYLEINLSSRDFSELTIWEANFRGVLLRNTDFRRANLEKSVFNDTFGAVLSVSFSNNGRLFALGSTNGEVRIGSTNDFKQLYVCRQHRSWVRALAFSPNDEVLISAGDDNAIELWDTKSGEHLGTFCEHSSRVLCLAVSADGKYLVFGSDDNNAYVWDFNFRRHVGTLVGHENWVWDIAISATGTNVVTASLDRSLFLWDIEKLAVSQKLLGHTREVWGVAITTDGKVIASASGDGTVRLWSSVNGECTRTLQGHTNWIWSVRFDPKQEIVTSAGDDGVIRFWHLNTGDILTTSQVSSGLVRDMCYSPDGTLLLTGTEEQRVQFWETSTGRCIRTFQGYTNRIRSVSFHPSNYDFVSGSTDKVVRYWRHSSYEYSELVGHQDRIRAVRLSSDGSIIASSSIDGTVKLWSSTTFSLNRTLTGHNGPVRIICIDKNGSLLASGGEDRTIRIWNMQSGKCEKVLKGHTDRVWAIGFDPTASILVSGSSDHTVRFWDYTTGECLDIRNDHTHAIRCVAFSQDGRYLATGGDDQTVKLWDNKSKDIIKVLNGHTGPIWSVVFDPLGRYLVSASSDQTVRIWSLDTFNCITVLKQHSSWVVAVDISYDGKRLVSSSDDETIILWDMDTFEAILVLRCKGPYEGMLLGGATGLNEAQLGSLRILGATDFE